MVGKRLKKERIGLVITTKRNDEMFQPKINFISYLSNNRSKKKAAGRIIKNIGWLGLYKLFNN